VLGDWELLKELPQGTFGRSFLAEHRFTCERVKLKVLPQEFAQDTGWEERLRSVVFHLARFEHPALIPLRQVNFIQGSCALASDYLDEPVVSLAEFLGTLGRRLTEDEVATLAITLAEVLDYAHGQSLELIAHYGIKLNNLLVQKTEQGLQFYVTDLGLASILGHGAVAKYQLFKMAEALGVSDPRLTNIGSKPFAFLKTSFLQHFAFMAPEQRWGGQVTAKADSFAFGVLIYYLLVGMLPEGAFEMPSLLVGTSTGWDALLRQCLNPDPSKRPSALTPLVEELSLARLRRLQGEGGIFKDKAFSLPTASLTQDKVHKGSVETSLQPISSEVRLIQGGAFFIGSESGVRDESPRHQVFLNSFEIDIHPVTNEQYVRFLEVRGEKDDEHHDLIRLRDSRIRRVSGRLHIESGYAKHPVVGVTWYGAEQYAAWVGKRLPTESEWEVAARGGLEYAPYPTGVDIEKTQANFFSSDTTAVMSYAPNGFGLYDMVGNVYEWCADWYGYNAYEEALLQPHHPKGPHQGVYRVLRGGCWKSLKEDLACSKRHRNNPSAVNSTYGFRCVRDVD
jgi:Uncharacterized conserved protein